MNATSACTTFSLSLPKTFGLKLEVCSVRFGSEADAAIGLLSARSRDRRRVKINDEDVIHAMTKCGVPIDRWLALGNHLVGYIDETGRLMAQLFEDDALAAAASALLKRRGQVYQAIATDKPV